MGFDNMKKIKLIILLLTFSLILCSCEKKEYNLIQITGEELVKNLTSEKKDFVFAMVDYSEEDTEQFLKDLKSVSKSANINIYYVDYLHLDKESAFVLFNLYTTDFTTNGFHVIQNNSLIVSNEYINFKEMYTLLKGKAYKNKLERVDQKTKENYIKEAKELYKENKIPEAHEKLCKAWDLKTAQEEHSKNKYYNLINVWERKEITADIPEKTNYKVISFHSGVNYYMYHEKSSLSEEFDDSFELNEAEINYFKINKDIIYTSNREKGYYEEAYQIIDVDDKFLQLKDLKSNKNITFTRRKNV
jgi:hypothetical protein